MKVLILEILKKRCLLSSVRLFINNGEQNNLSIFYRYV
jgi:hypothetical protein